MKNVLHRISVMSTGILSVVVTLKSFTIIQKDRKLKKKKIETGIGKKSITDRNT